MQWATDWQIKPWEYLGIPQSEIDVRRYRAWVLASIEARQTELEKARRKAKK